MSTDDNVERAVVDRSSRLPLSPGGKKAAQHPDSNRVIRYALAECLEMLLRQHGSGYQHCRLFPAHIGFERRTKRHFRLAKTDIATDQSIHWLLRFHVPFGFLDRSKLIWSLRVQKRGFEFSLPFGIGRKGIPRQRVASRLQIQQTSRIVEDRRFGCLFRSTPFAIS